MAQWQISGEYMETCNCELLCPCIYTNMTARPTEGECKVALAARIDKGQKDGVSLAGVKFMVVLHSPGPMANGNLTVGLIIDKAASEAQAEAVAAIATGQAGGPMDALGPLVGKVAGIERREVTFEMNGLNRARGRTGGSGLRRPARRGPESGYVPGQRGASRRQPPVAGQGDAQRLQCLRHQVGRQDRQAQRPLRAVRVERLSRYARRHHFTSVGISSRGSHSIALGARITNTSTSSIGMNSTSVSLMAALILMPPTVHAIIRHRP
jgi:hypothetical protein